MVADVNPVDDPGRKHLPHLPPMEFRNPNVILYVTRVVAGRRSLLARQGATETIRDAWRKADHWLVGRYVLMPGDNGDSRSSSLRQDNHRRAEFHEALTCRAFIQGLAELVPPSEIPNLNPNCRIWRRDPHGSGSNVGPVHRGLLEA